MPRHKTGARINRTRIGIHQTLGDHATMSDKFIERFRGITVISVSAAAESAPQGNRSHREATSHLLGHTVLHIIDIGTTGIYPVCVQINLQAGYRF